MAKTLQLHEVSFGYDRAEPAVVEGFSAGLAAGKVTALIGPNAAGKSTLMKLMLGLLEPWSGTVELEGRPVATCPARQRAAWMSYVPQRVGASFTFTVEEVVRMGRYALPWAPQAVEAALELCDLKDLRTRVYAWLSMGQQQRVLLARAVAQARGAGKVMLLDEPGSAMDLWHTHHTMRILRDLASNGLAVLVILHDLNLASKYADEVWLLQNGRLQAQGPWQAVLRPPTLEPVYRVGLEALGTGRPVFTVRD